MLSGVSRTLAWLALALAHGLASGVDRTGLTALGRSLKKYDFARFVKAHPTLAKEKVYVYQLPARFNSQNLPPKGLEKDWNMNSFGEWRMSNWMAQINPLRVRDINEATMFFVPVWPVSYCSHILHVCRPKMGGGSSCAEFPDLDGCDSGRILLLKARDYIRVAPIPWGATVPART